MDDVLEDRTIYKLTTVDNPFNPWTDWDPWYAWDRDAGYHTPSYLARIAFTSDDLSPADQSLAVQQAIDEIVRLNVTGMHRKVAEPSG